MQSDWYNDYKKWKAGGKIWLISDTHFMDYDEKDWLPAEKLLEKINRAVGEKDTLICLGDCGEVSFFKEVHCGYKVLIKGNHDEEKDEYYLEKGGFDQVFSKPLFISEQILLSHEPVYGLDFCLNIHGHMHTGKHQYIDERGGRHINLVGPAVDYRPMELDEILEYDELCRNRE